MQKSVLKFCAALLVLTFLSFAGCREEVVNKKTPGINNSNHPQIAYWFLTPEILVNDKYLTDLDYMIDHTLFNFIFLDARNGCSFDNVEVMHPVMEKIVALAHKRNIKIGYRAQVKGDKQEHEESTERFIAEAETTLDRSGNGNCSLNAEFVRSSGSHRKDVYKVFLFKKTADGFYDPASCRETADYTFSVKDQTVNVNIKAGKEMSGYTAYVMAQFYYSKLSNHSPEAAEGVIRFINTYADIPFDGVMLDEYGNAQIIPPWKMMFKWGNYLLRSFSLPMARELESRTAIPAFQTLFDMRYAPAGKPDVRIKAINAINPVENCARLMNRFNPSLPEIKLLVIFGNEALQNWYPDKADRGSYDINDRLKIEEKSVKIWEAGFLNALVPTDLISGGKLRLDSVGKPVLCGHKFDAIVFLYPQYSKESTLKFLEEYVNKGGKLMMAGAAAYDFNGNDISVRIRSIYEMAIIKEFSVNRIPELGLTRNVLAGGCKNEDGSYVFTDISSLRNNRPKIFKLSFGQDIYSGDYSGFSAILADPLLGLQKLACAGFSELKKNGVTILKLEYPGDIFVEKVGKEYQVTITGPKENNQLLINKLN